MATNHSEASSRAGRPRPIGWWLKEADARLDAAFEVRLSRHGFLSRRDWQVLASVARAPTTAPELIRALAAFDSAEIVAELLDDLIDRGWLVAEGTLLRLTPEGTELYVALAAEVEQVRLQVAAALPGEAYALLVSLLGRLVDALPPIPDTPGSS